MKITTKKMMNLQATVEVMPICSKTIQSIKVEQVMQKEVNILEVAKLLLIRNQQNRNNKDNAKKT